MFCGLHAPHALPEPQALIQVGRAFTPRIEARGETPVLLDLHGLGRAWPVPEALGHALLEAARQRRLEPHVALAFTKTAALVVARGRSGLTVVPAGAEARAMAPLPLEILDLEAERIDLLRRWGVRRIGDLLALPATGLAERLGPDGPRLLRLARGEDLAPLVPTLPPESFRTTLELDWAVDGLEPLSFLLTRVLETLCESLRARGRKAAGLALELVKADGGVHRRALRPAAPTVLPRTWRALLLLDLEAHPPGEAVTRITVEAEPTPARQVQFSLLDPAQPSPERLAETMARLHEWTAGGRSGSPALLDTHRPGAFAVETFAPGAHRPRRPDRLPPRPALRVFRPPLSADVVVRQGAPAFVSAPGLRGAVDERAGPWRASGDWWDVAYSREEWDVMVGGALYRLVHDRLRGAWLVEGVVD
jgi:protein ImuB